MTDGTKCINKWRNERKWRIETERRRRGWTHVKKREEKCPMWKRESKLRRLEPKVKKRARSEEESPKWRREPEVKKGAQSEEKSLN